MFSKKILFYEITVFSHGSMLFPILSLLRVCDLIIVTKKSLFSSPPERVVCESIVQNEKDTDRRITQIVTIDLS